MSILLVAVGLIGALILVIVRTLAADEVRGRIQQRIKADVEGTIESLTEELQDEWADEWRAELAAVLSMPLTAAIFARGLRQSAIKLMADTVPALSNARSGQPSRSRTPSFARPTNRPPIAAMADKVLRWAITLVRRNPLQTMTILSLIIGTLLAILLGSINPLIIGPMAAVAALMMTLLIVDFLERRR